MRYLLTAALPAVFFVATIAVQVQAQALLHPATQPQFIHPLPLPSVMDVRAGGTFTMQITQFEQWLGLIDPGSGNPLLTNVWGYNGSYPGPTILAQKNVPVNIFWLNKLLDNNGQPLPHLLPVDTTVHWAFTGTENWQQYGVPVVTHVHGGLTESASDGLPDNWYTPDFTKKGKGFVKGDLLPYHYNNDEEASTIWYHDHALGITRLNVYAGLAGFYLVTDDNETALKAGGKLPAGPYDIGLAIQDRMFTNNGQLFYPSAPEEAGQPSPSVQPEFFGNFILVNGKAWPVLEVEPRPYRFRILNGSDSRFYNLFLSSGQTITQIGTDDGLLPSPVPLNQLLIGTGERKDVVIDFSDPALWGQTIVLKNNARSPFPKGRAVNPMTTGRIMAFRVNRPLNTTYPLTTLPTTLRPPITPLQTALPARKLILFEAEDEYDRLKPMLGTVEQGTLPWDHPVTENPALGSTEIWEIYNETQDAHTIHLHMVHMQLVNRQKFTADIDETTGKPSNIKFVGTPVLPTADEAGWKDTYISYPGQVLRVITKFEKEGPSVWHCHLLSHEDHEMMRPYFIGTMPARETITKAKTADVSPDLEKQLQLTVLPNPFSNGFRIQLNLPASSDVTIRVYDAKGGLMQQTNAGKRSAGIQQISIDGSNWTNGIYFCEVMINNQRLVRKLTRGL